MGKRIKVRIIREDSKKERRLKKASVDPDLVGIPRELKRLAVGITEDEKSDQEKFIDVDMPQPQDKSAASNLQGFSRLQQRYFQLMSELSKEEFLQLQQMFCYHYSSATHLDKLVRASKGQLNKEK